VVFHLLLIIFLKEVTMNLYLFCEVWCSEGGVRKESNTLLCSAISSGKQWQLLTGTNPRTQERSGFKIFMFIFL